MMLRRFLTRAVAPLLVAMLTVAGCSNESDTPNHDEWESGAPAAVGAAIKDWDVWLEAVCDSPDSYMHGEALWVASSYFQGWCGADPVGGVPIGVDIFVAKASSPWFFDVARIVDDIAGRPGWQQAWARLYVQNEIASIDDDFVWVMASSSSRDLASLEAVLQPLEAYGFELLTSDEVSDLAAYSIEYYADNFIVTPSESEPKSADSDPQSTSAGQGSSDGWTIDEVAEMTCMSGELSNKTTDFDDLLPNAIDLAWCGFAADGSGMLLYGVYSSVEQLQDDVDLLDSQFNTASVYFQDPSGSLLLVAAYDAGMTGPNDPSADLELLEQFGFEPTG